MADGLSIAVGAQRTADVLLQGTGGRKVLLRLPAPSVPSDVTEQLGLAVPEFQDIELGPVVVCAAKTGGRQAGTTRRMLVSASAVNKIVGSLGYSAASVLFEGAFGVLVDGVLLEVITATECEACGVPYLYQVTLRVPAGLAV